MGFITEMLALGTIPAYVSLACIAVFAFYIIWHIIGGYRRGIFRQLFHTGFVIVSAVVAFIGSNVMCGIILNYLDGKSVTDIVSKVESLIHIDIPETAVTILSVFDVQAFEQVLMLPLGVLIMPFVFMGLFFVINIIFKLFYLLSICIFHVDAGVSSANKLSGLVLGAIEGVIVAVMILLPFAGVSGVAGDAYDVIVESNEEYGREDSAAEKMLCDYTQPFAKNPLLGLIDGVVSEPILDKLATFENGNAEINMRDEAYSVIRFAFADLPAFKDTDWFALTENDKEVIGGVVDFVSESDYKASLVAEILCAMDRLVDILGVSEEDGSVDVIVALFNVFDNIDTDELPDVLNTFKKFYFLASDGDVLGGFASGDRASLTNAFTTKDESGKTTVDKMVAVLNENTRTSTLVSTLTKMTITVLSNSMGLDENAVTKYNDIKADLSSAIASIDKSKTKEEQVADVSASLSESFTKNGMTVETGALNNMAVYVVDNYADSGELSDAEFDSIMLNYYQSNKDSINSSVQ